MQLHVSEHASLDEALSASEYAEDAGDESLHHIEVIEDGVSRRIDRAEVDRLLAPTRAREAKEYAERMKERPNVAMIRLHTGNDHANFEWFTDHAEADARRATLATFLGDRVELVSLPLSKEERL